MAYDVVVIGTGPGGYVCAIKAAQLGLKTAVVEKRATLRRHLRQHRLHPVQGAASRLRNVRRGRPLLRRARRRGCQAEAQSEEDAGAQGHDGRAERQGPRFPDEEEQDRRLSRHRQGASRAGKVSVTGEDGKAEEIETKNIVIATGSDVAGIPGVKVEIDEKVIVSSTGALSLDKVPGHLIVVGGGVIGLELGSVWARLGAKVTVVEYLDTILGGMDGEVAKQFQRMLAKQGFDIKLGSKVTGVEEGQEGRHGHLRAGEGRRGRDDRGRCRADRHRPQALYRRARPCRGRRRARRARPREDRRRISRPTCRASTRSAT